jgi:hypothetical protein
MLTLNQVVQRIKTIAKVHKQIKNFYYGNVTDFLGDKKTRYASLFLQDSPGVIDPASKAVTMNFKIYLLDLENVSEDTQQNTLDVQSDMLSVGTDLISEFDFSSYTDWRVSASSPFSLVREKFSDVVAGVVIDISIPVPYDKDTCAVPNN